MRTFSFEQLAQRHVPRPEDFQQVVGQVRQVLGNCKYAEWAILVGSVLRRQQNMASDLDLVICWRKGMSVWERQLAFAQVGQVRRFALHHWIETDLAAVSAEALAYDCHTLNPGYVSHLNWAVRNGGCVAGDPASLQAMPVSSLQDAHAYLALKIKRCENMLSLPETSWSADVWQQWAKTIFTSFQHVLRRLGDLEGLSEDEGQLNPSGLLSAGALTLYCELSKNRQLHLAAMHRQLESPNQKEWETEQSRVSLAGITLLCFLLEVQSELWKRFGKSV